MNLLKVRRIGNSLGVILPAEVLDRLHVEEGQELVATMGPEGLVLRRPRLVVSDQELADFVKNLGQHHDVAQGLGNE